MTAQLSYYLYMFFGSIVVNINELQLIFFVLIVSTILSFALAIPIINVLYKFKLTRGLAVDFSAIIDSRKTKQGTPVMGGLIFIVPVLMLNVLINFNGSTIVPLIVFAISAVLGGADDVLNIYGRNRRVRPLTRTHKLMKIHANPWVRLKLIVSYPWILYKNFFFMLGSNPGKGIQAHEKILINSIAGFAVFYWLTELTGWSDSTVLFFPFNLNLDIGIILMFWFVLLTVLVMTNAVNIADGMDGLSAGMLIPAFLAFLVIAILEQNLPIAVICASAIGGLSAYLYFNIPPARVQMGDIGSLAMGTLLAVIALEMRLAFLLAIVCLPFLLEFASSLIQGIARRLLGRRIWRMAPLHHHFEMIGWPEEKVVMRFHLFANLSAIVGISVYLLY